MKNLLTIDLEDWYQTNSYKAVVSVSSWDRFEGVLNNTTFKILDILQKFKLKATFFILAYNARRFPELIRSIQAQGHELGIHGYHHELVYDQTPEQFAKDVRQAKSIVEDICQKEVIGYRAPNWSINSSCRWAFDILHQAGFSYDSSVKEGEFNKLKPDMPEGLMEICLSEFRFLHVNIPFGGGFFLRAYPYCFTSSLIRKRNLQGQGVVVYLHPWEFDASRRDVNPGLRGSIISSFNLSKTESIFFRLLDEFEFDSIKNIFFSEGPDD